MSLSTNDFVNHAIAFFDVLKWKPAPPDSLSEPHLVVYGNLNSTGHGTHCVIDTKAKLFKINLNVESLDQKLFTKIVVRYHTDAEAIQLFEHYMDCLGGFLKEAWLGK